MNWKILISVIVVVLLLLGGYTIYAKKIPFLRSACDPGYFLDETGICSPVCPGEPEICNNKDDDCDGQIDEDRVCAINPLSATGSFVRQPREVATLKDDSGLHVRAAHDQLLVYFEEPLTDEEKRSLLSELEALGAFVIGQVPGKAITTWQVQVSNPSELAATREALLELETVEYINFNETSSFTFN